ncbi:MAG: thiamine phosphate synthase [Phycisphaeraceae bacterium]|nr:thiamine phosphate synthase [Phycisphaeraceae bacterium]
MNTVFRILDANHNRAREAIRVMEDAARFLLDHVELAAALKNLRHDLTETCSAFPAIVLDRDTPGDVGTEITTGTEQVRTGVGHVVRAAASRLSEALRSLEEFSKTLDVPAGMPSPAGRFEALRYRGYELARQLDLALGHEAKRQWRLCLLISRHVTGDRPWLDVARAAVEGGVDCLQLRIKQGDDRLWLEDAIALVELGRSLGADVIINDRTDIALASEADGVHLGRNDLPIEAARRLTRERLLIGLSTANMADAEQAVRAGADYVGIGPMFTSTTKAKPELSGPEYARAFCARFPDMPHLAISGVGPDNLGILLEAGVRGIAVCGAICNASDPREIARKLRSDLDQALQVVES